MIKNCGSCIHFENEMIDGFGFCVVFQCIHHCTGSGRCIAYQLKNNGWTEITPDNVEGLYDVDPCRLMIATIDSHGNPQYAKYDGMSTTLDAMATIGGCYSLVLPELRLEE